ASLLGLASIGLFVSTLTDAPVGAMAATAGFAVLSAVLDNVPQTQAIHPWLFTHHWLAFGDLIRSPVHWTNIVADLRLQAGYIAVFAAAAWARFKIGRASCRESGEIAVVAGKQKTAYEMAT